MAAAALLGASLCSILIAGCGEGAGHGGSVAESAPPIERVDPPAPLPPGWATQVNGPGGFSVGSPPGWRASSQGPRTTLRAPRGSVIVSISADRSGEALAADLGEFAAEIATGLSPRFDDLEIGDPAATRSAYEAAALTASGTHRKSGIRQTVRVVVVRRKALAAYPILMAGNPPSVRRLSRQLRQIVGSLRGRPIG